MAVPVRALERLGPVVGTHQNRTVSDERFAAVGAAFSCLFFELFLVGAGGLVDSELLHDVLLSQLLVEQLLELGCLGEVYADVL